VHRLHKRPLTPLACWFQLCIQLSHLWERRYLTYAGSSSTRAHPVRWTLRDGNGYGYTQQQARLHAATWTQTQGSQGTPDSLAAPTPLTKPRNELEQLPSSASPPRCPAGSHCRAWARRARSASRTTETHRCPLTSWPPAGERAWSRPRCPAAACHTGCQGRPATSIAGRHPVHSRRLARVTAGAAARARATLCNQARTAPCIHIFAFAEY